jgi:hypothetical protein
MVKKDPSYVATAGVLYACLYTRAPGGRGVRGAPGICNFKAMRVSKLYKTAHSEPTVGKPNY